MTTPIKKPSRAELEAFLWKVHASECFEQDALDILAEAEGTKLERVLELVRIVSAEIDQSEMNIEGEDPRADLRSLRDTARRGAILLLYAAWYADRSVPRAKTPPEGSGAAEQADLFGGDP